MSKRSESHSMLKRILKVFGVSAAIGIIGGMLAPPKKKPGSLRVTEERETVSHNGHGR